MIVTADTDFPTLVALRRMTTPSVVLMRAVAGLTVDRHIDLLPTNLPTGRRRSAERSDRDYLP